MGNNVEKAITDFLDEYHEACFEANETVFEPRTADTWSQVLSNDDVDIAATMIGAIAARTGDDKFASLFGYAVGQFRQIDRAKALAAFRRFLSTVEFSDDMLPKS